MYTICWKDKNNDQRYERLARGFDVARFIRTLPNQQEIRVFPPEAEAYVMASDFHLLGDGRGDTTVCWTAANKGLCELCPSGKAAKALIQSIHNKPTVFVFPAETAHMILTAQAILTEFVELPHKTQRTYLSR